MNIVFYSNIFFTDCDFSLIREFQQKGIRITYYIQVISGRQCGGLLDLRSYNLSPGIYQASIFPEFKKFEKFLNLSNVYIVWKSSHLSDFSNWITYFKLFKAIKKENPTVVHIAGELGLSEFLLYFFRKKMVQTVHDPLMHSGEKNWLSEIRRNFSFKLASKLVLLNENQKRDFMERYGVPKNKVFSNRLGVYEALNCIFANCNSNFEYPQKYVLFFGHISQYKGIDTLCNAMLKVHSVVPDLTCVIAGKGDLYFNFEPFKKYDFIRLENRFISSEELSWLIEKSLFVICPYKDATQSGVVSSAFAMLKPVLATNVGGLGESVLDEVTGRLVPPNNPDLLALTICDMVKNKSKLTNYSNNIKNIFWSGNKSWSSIADKFFEIYENKNGNIDKKIF